ncbi:putative transposase [Streptococcus pneumoniae]|nr:putative transposase [Streptococcus pneumoniae]VRC13615.1 putative transposase [Streptococcus pneumoniae]
MDRGYESYNLMAHFQEKGWLYIIRIRDGKQSMPSSFNLPNTECFDQKVSLKLSRKQTNQLKNFIVIFPMTIILFHTILFLIFFQKQVENKIL